MNTLKPDDDVRLQAILLLADLAQEIEKLNKQTLTIMQILLDDLREDNK